MASRIELHNKLVELFGCPNVYYQPPENLKLKYPAIRYHKENMTHRFADNTKFINNKRYEIMVIDQAPDNPVIDKILELPYSSFNTHYIADNLSHDSITLYW